MQPRLLVVVLARKYSDTPPPKKSCFLTVFEFSFQRANVEKVNLLITNENELFRIFKYLLPVLSSSPPKQPHSSNLADRVTNKTNK